MFVLRTPPSPSTPKSGNVCGRRYKDNTAVQNIRGIYEDNPKKQSSQKKGFTAQELAKILGVKMLSCDPNAMDTSVGRSRSFKPKTQGCAANVTVIAQTYFSLFPFLLLHNTN